MAPTDNTDRSPAETSLWPSGNRCALCVTIDVDGTYGEGNSRPADDTYWLSQTAYDPRGTERLLGVLADRGVAATFCWVGRAAEDRPLLVRAAVASGHEIALHSWEHRAYNQMTSDEQRADMERTQEILSRIAGSPAVGHKTASWRFNDDTARVAQELGLLWIMDEPGGDLPYLIQPDASLPAIVQLPPSRWFDDYAVFVDQLSPPEHVFDLWRSDLDVLRDEGGLMCLTLHPFVSGRPGPSRALAWLLDYAIDLGDVWIERADRIARWWIDEREGARAPG